MGEARATDMDAERNAGSALADIQRRLAALEALLRAQHARIAALEASPHPLAMAEPAPNAAIVAAPPHKRRIAPEAFIGWGFHDLEGGGGASWRWFGQDTALDLPDLRLGDRILLELVAIAPGIGTEQLFVTLDGEAATALLEGPEEKPLLAITPPPGFQPKVETVLLRLAFETAYAPPGDQRLLTMACKGIVVEQAGEGRHTSG